MRPFFPVLSPLPSSFPFSSALSSPLFPCFFLSRFVSRRCFLGASQQPRTPPFGGSLHFFFLSLFVMLGVGNRGLQTHAVSDHKSIKRKRGVLGRCAGRQACHTRAASRVNRALCQSSTASRSSSFKNFCVSDSHIKFVVKALAFH